MNSLIIDEPALQADAADFRYLDRQCIPHHIAIIMDGNRRWARQNGLPAMFGHWKGAEMLPKIVRAASNLGVKVLTVYAFSTENWLRANDEIDALMHLFHVYLEGQREPMRKEGVRLQTIGDLERLPSKVLKSLEVTKQATAEGKKIDLVLALNYGGRDDIRRAVVAMVEDIERGKLSKDEISEQKIGAYLDTSPWPDPDVLIRTSGEKRQSNFLLWQLSYSEFYHTDVLWPDFNEQELVNAIAEFQRRKRRFGGK
jgi:undecaprenyl diphosphate synthase